jgi:hypothetical protein
MPQKICGRDSEPPKTPRPEYNRRPVAEGLSQQAHPATLPVWRVELITEDSSAAKSRSRQTRVRHRSETTWPSPPGSGGDDASRRRSPDRSALPRSEGTRSTVRVRHFASAADGHDGCGRITRSGRVDNPHCDGSAHADAEEDTEGRPRHTVESLVVRQAGRILLPTHCESAHWIATQKQARTQTSVQTAAGTSSTTLSA